MKRSRRVVRSFLSLFLSGAALWIARDVLREYSFHQVVSELAAIPLAHLAAALAFTVLGYLALVAYDFVALRFIRRPLGIRTVLPVSFVSYAVQNSAPVAILTGGGLRYRLYGHWGLSAVESAEITAVDTATYVLGLFAVGGVVFLLEPVAVPRALHLPVTSLHPVGIAFLAIVAAYLIMAAVRRRPIRLHGLEVHAPTPRLATAQIVISCFDWLFSGAALWVVLPAEAPVSYPAFLGIFLVALSEGVGRFIRLLVAIAATLVAMALIRLVRRAPARPELPGPGTLDRACAVVERSPRASARLALLGDKAFLFAQDDAAFVMYGTSGRSMIALGDPLGPEAEQADLAWRFRDLAARDGAWAVVYDIAADRAGPYVDLGLQLEPLGEAAMVALDRSIAAIEALARPLVGTGCEFTVVPRQSVPAVLPELGRVERAWRQAGGRQAGAFARAYQGGLRSGVGAAVPGAPGRTRPAACARGRRVAARAPLGRADSHAPCGLKPGYQAVIPAGHGLPADGPTPASERCGPGAR